MLEERTFIYLDYHATTPVDPRVAQKVLSAMTEEFGNAHSADHVVGDRAETAVKTATLDIANLIGASPREIIFTSGATESINLAIQGTINACSQAKPDHSNHTPPPRVAISAVEHQAVLDTCHALEKQGRIEVIPIPIDTKACIDLDSLERICSNGLHLLCVMAANNEVGTIYPIDRIARIAQRYNVPFLCDASQAAGKLPLRFSDWGITMLALSAHKLYGPQGVGALVVQRGHRLKPLLYGGGHQRGLRPGTLNLPGIVGLGEACRLRSLEMETDEPAIAQKRDRLQHLLTAAIPNLVVNGDTENRLAGNLHISVPGIPNSAAIARVRHQLAISTGSACSSGVEAPSHVLRAMKLPEAVIEGAFRLGLGKFTTEREIVLAADILINAIRQIPV